MDKQFTIEDVNSAHMVPFIPMMSMCKTLFGSGIKTDKNVSYAVVMQTSNFNNYVILTTHTSYKNSRGDINNLETSLTTTHGAETVEVVFATADTIAHFIAIGEKELLDKNEIASSGGVAKSEAKRRFQSIIEDAVKLGAADVDFRVIGQVGSYAFKVNGKMTTRYNLSAEHVRLMTGAMLQTETENMSGSISDEQIMAKTTPLIIEQTVDGKSRREEVRLRGLKASANGGYSYSLRIIRTRQEDSRSIDELGFEQSHVKTMKWLSSQPSGIVLILGPTGHGKTVTLKTLFELMPAHWKIILIEDPVEYIVNHPNCTQEDILPEFNLTAHAFQKAALRQFPNVIGISEIRDDQISKDVINSALSGHLMVSTLHTHDTLSAPERLRELGVSLRTQSQPGLFKALISQRLLPELCDCAISGTKPLKWVSHYKVINPTGCIKCNKSGIIGRRAVAEILVFDYHVRKLLANDNLVELEPYLRTIGWKSMRDYGVELVKAGAVDPADLMHTLGDPSETIDASWDYGSAAFTLSKGEAV